MRPLPISIIVILCVRVPVNVTLRAYPLLNTPWIASVRVEGILCIPNAYA